ncbi:MAG: PLP-dependent aminotransferase family protein [Peptococcaceae bacterium]|nr:PLP-dependent aminotransferase family protein [Peptococcaceae bacterium]
MFTIIFDKKIKTPLYDQLYQFLKTEISTGRLAPGEKLPSKRKLAAHLKISQNTIETAYGQLQAEGYITALPKKGFFVEEISDLLPLQPTKTKHTPQNPKSSEAADLVKTNQSYLYDFRTNVVNTDDFPFDTWSRVLRTVLAEDRNQLLKPLPFQGYFLLREEIARYLYAYRGIETSAEQIIIGAGSEYLLSLLIQLFGRNHTFAIENPGYEKIRQIFQNHHLAIDYITTTQESLDMTSLINSTADILHITPSHHFPLGCVMPIQLRFKVLTWANEKENRYIIEDDYDSEFRFAGKPIPALASLDQQEKVIYLNTFTKSLAPSLRISYMVLPKHLMTAFSQRFSGYASTVPSFEQSALAMFMTKGHFERHINKMKRLYKIQRDTVIQAIKNHPLEDHIHIIGEDTGLHLLLQVNIGLTESQLVKTALQKGIYLTGLSSYYHQGIAPISKNTLVLGYSGLTPEAIRQGMKLLLDTWQEAAANLNKEP